MTKQEFSDAIQTIATNTSLVGAVERKYNVSLPENVGKVLSILPHGGFLDGNDLCRVMSSSEIVSANENLHTDFVSMKLLPMLDLGDNVFVVFDFNRQEFGRFSLNDELVYKRSATINEIL